MAARLKVYRTPIGFHNAYVAAPSQKAALAAWGAKVDLFARGAAELVTNEALVAEPLATPGQVIRRSRGTTAEQLAALPPDSIKAASKSSRSAADKKPAPKPGRAALDDAEAALGAAQARHTAAHEEVEDRQRALDRERRELEAAQADEIDSLEAKAAVEREAYSAKLAEWRGS